MSLFLVHVEFEMPVVPFMEVFGSRERYRIVLLHFSKFLKYGDRYFHPGPWLMSVPKEPDL